MSGKAYKTIGLSLSGGGARAIAYHCGILQWMAENNLLQKVEQVTTVSGGSIFLALLLNANSNKWPTNQEYVDLVGQKIRHKITQTNILKATLKLCLKPANWRNLLSRAPILSQAMQKEWQLDARFHHLPDLPIWTTNSLTTETGLQFVFRKNEMGDEELGYVSPEKFLIADAIAASAAHPLFVGPYIINTKDYFNSEGNDLSIRYKKLHLFDGAVYDNFGLEQIFDISTQLPKHNLKTLIVADASSSLNPMDKSNKACPLPFKRLAELLTEQQRRLTIEAFKNFSQKTDDASIYLEIDAEATQYIEKYDPMNKKGLKAKNWLTADQVNRVKSTTLHLSKMPEDVFDLVKRQGYEVAALNHSLFVEE